VLVIDDSEAVRVVVVRALDIAGFEPAAVGTGQEGLALLALDDLPAVVVLDVWMPHLNGLETLNRIRVDPRTTHVPVIMHTSDRDGAVALLAWTLGCDGYVLKETGCGSLTAELNVALGRDDAERAAAREINIALLKPAILLRRGHGRGAQRRASSRHGAIEHRTRWCRHVGH
jgi:CheY-like chemotaxis protein